MDAHENAMAAAEFFDRISAEVMKKGGRPNLRREYIYPPDLPVAVRRARAYDAETERLRVELRSAVAA